MNASSNSTHKSDTPGGVTSKQTDGGKRKKRKLQVNLLTILLFIFACAVWIAYQRSATETVKLQQQLVGLRLIARELVVDNPTEFSAITRIPKLYGELIWDVHVPETKNAMRLCLAMDQLNNDSPKSPGDTTPLKESTLSSGRHSIELRDLEIDDQHVVTVLVDGKVVIEENRAKDWIDSGGYSSTTSIEATSKSFAADEIIVLHKRRFMTEKTKGGSRAPKGPASGIYLWVEPSNLNK